MLIPVILERGHIASEEGREYRVPYRILQQLEEHANVAPSRSPEYIEDISQLVRDLLALHQLPHWSFQFDNGTKHAECCQYTIYVISLLCEFAKRALEEEMRDPLLHEDRACISRQRVHHDAMWRAKALKISSSGRRYRDLQFTPL